MKLNKNYWLSLRPGWTPLPVALAVAGYFIWWPLAPCVLAYIVIGEMVTKRRDNVEDPYGDWPQCEIRGDKGTVRVTGQYREPSAWWQRTFPSLLMLVSLGALPWSCSSIGASEYGSSDNIPWDFTWKFMLGYVALLILLVMWGNFRGRRREIDVTFSDDKIRIGHKNYTRSGALNQFEIDRHEKAFAEERALREQNRRRLYSDAVQVIMRYGGKRVPIAGFDLGDMRKAEALLVRLQTVNASFDEAFDQALLSASGITPDESGDFGRAAPLR
jgi:hypothetical protein